MEGNECIHWINNVEYSPGDEECKRKSGVVNVGKEDPWCWLSNGAAKKKKNVSDNVAFLILDVFASCLE